MQRKEGQYETVPGSSNSFADWGSHSNLPFSQSVFGEGWLGKRAGLNGSLGLTGYEVLGVCACGPLSYVIILPMQKIFLNTDGGARGNPGPAGLGAVLSDENKKTIATASKYIGEATNNEAEYQAVLLGLDLLKQNLKPEIWKETKITLRVDSQLIARQIKGEYKVKEERLKVFCNQIKQIIKKDFPQFEIMEIRREQNQIADGLANEAMDKGQMI